MLRCDRRPVSGKRLGFFTIIILVGWAFAACEPDVTIETPPTPLMSPAQPVAEARVSSEAGDQTEPSIAVNPLDPQHLIAGAIDVPLEDCRFFVSFDGGASWTSGGTLEKDPYVKCTDPSVAFTSTGEAFFVGFFHNNDFSSHNTFQSRVGIARSPDGGVSYDTPNYIDGVQPGLYYDLQSGVDKSYVAIDQTEGEYAGNMYIALNTFLHDATNGSLDPVREEYCDLIGGDTICARHIRVLSSSDQFASNVNNRKVSFVISNSHAANPAVGPDGEVYAAWRQFHTYNNVRWSSDHSIMITKSTDGGTNWSTNVVIDEIGPENASVAGPLRTTRYPVVAVSHGEGDIGNVYVAYADDPDLETSFDFVRALDPTTRIYHINEAGMTVGDYTDQRISGVIARSGFLQFPQNVSSNNNSTRSDRPIVVNIDHDSTAYGINNANRIVGSYQDGTNIHGFLLDGNGFSTSPGFPPIEAIDYPGAAETILRDINDVGQIVGSYRLSNGTAVCDTQPDTCWHGLLREVDGTFEIITYPGALETNANGINKVGEIVGCYLDASSTWHGFLRDQTNNYMAINFSGADETCVWSINDVGEMVGWYSPGTGARQVSGFIRDSNGNFTSIDYSGNAIVSTFPTGINNAGNIVGWYEEDQSSPTPNVEHGFLTSRSLSQEIWLSRSSDGGDTWTNPVRVNDTIDGDQFDPWMCAGPEGRLHIAWLDRREDPANMLYDVYYATSSDGGQTFSPNQKISTVSSDPQIADRNGFIGDYIGLACGRDTAYLAWPDLRNSDPAQAILDQDIYSSTVVCGLEDNGDGTVSDTCTGLMWLQDANYAHTSGDDDDGGMVWETAMQWVEGLSFAGYDDWRLPVAHYPDLNCKPGATPIIAVGCIWNELVNLNNFHGITPSNQDLFINIQGSGGCCGPWYWSETEFNSGRAFLTSIKTGEMGSANKPNENFIWPVRYIDGP